jgi:hypothetical protein
MVDKGGKDRFVGYLAMPIVVQLLRWLSSIVSNFEPNVDIIIGYGPYKHEKDFGQNI